MTALTRVARRIVRKVVKPARLWLLRMEERSTDDHFSDLVAMHEAIPRRIALTQRELVRLAEKRNAIERGLA